jgi:hypothetical protein
LVVRRRANFGSLGHDACWLLVRAVINDTGWQQRTGDHLVVDRLAVLTRTGEPNTITLESRQLVIDNLPVRNVLEDDHVGRTVAVTADKDIVDDVRLITV